MSDFKRYLKTRHAWLFRPAAALYGTWLSCKYLIQRRRGSLNYLKCLFSAIFKTEKSLGHPVLLTVEPTNVCDQRCLICETGQGQLGRASRMMTFDEFRNILDQFDDDLRILYFYFMGESFLNRDAYRMIRYAADRGLFVSACTNGNCVDPEQLVRSGIADIQFQIAGTTQETHATYRVGGDLNAAISNLRETIRLRNELGDAVARPYPMRVGFGLILMKHNEHQIDDFERLAVTCGVDGYQAIDPCVRTVEQGRVMLPTDKRHWIYDPAAFESGKLVPRVRPRNYCEWIYSTMTVQANGDVVPCCRDPKGCWPLGNVFKDNAYSIWNGEKYRQMRRQVATAQRGLWLCSLCEGYSLPRLQS